MNLSKQIRNELLEMVKDVAILYNDLIPTTVTVEELEPVINAIDAVVEKATEKLMNIVVVAAPSGPEPLLPISPPVSRLLPTPELTPDPEAALPLPRPTITAEETIQPPPPITLPSEGQRSISQIAGLGAGDMAITDDNHGPLISVVQEERMNRGLPANPARPHIVIDHSGAREYPTERHFREAGSHPPVVTPRRVTEGTAPSAPPREAVNEDLPEEAPGGNPKV